MADGFDITAAATSIGNDLFGGEDSSITDKDTTPSTETPPPAAEVGEELDLELPGEGLPAAEGGEKEGEEAAANAAADAAFAPPKTWRKEAVAEWNTLSQTVKSEILKREEDMFKGIESYKHEANFGRTVGNILQPYSQIMQQHGIDPLQQISGLMQAHYTLAMGSPEQKLQLLEKIVADYGIDTTNFGVAPYVDPTVKNLLNTVKTLESNQMQFQEFQKAQDEERARNEIEAFVNDPANIYAKELYTDMANLIGAGQAKGLSDAYKKAIWLNESVRAKELARQREETLATARAKAKAKADAAKKAMSANVTTSAKSASQTAPLGSIDDTLKKTLTEIQNRS